MATLVIHCRNNLVFPCIATGVLPLLLSVFYATQLPLFSNQNRQHIWLQRLENMFAIAGVTNVITSAQGFRSLFQTQQGTALSNDHVLNRSWDMSLREPLGTGLS